MRDVLSLGRCVGDVPSLGRCVGDVQLVGDDLDDLLDEIEGEFREKSCKPATSSYKGTGYVCSDVT